MPVLIEAISVVIKVRSIHNQYPGGWTSFVEHIPNQTLCSDNDLARVGFMSPDAIKEFINRLENAGLTHLSSDNAAVDIVVCDQQRGPTAQCDWIEVGSVPWEGKDGQSVTAARLKGNDSNTLFTPDAWQYKGSLSDNYTFVENGHVPEFLDFVEKKDGILTYRDIRTQKLVYIPEGDRSPT